MIEAGYTRAIHSKLKPTPVYAWKIADRFTNGVPDAYYSGPKSDLWIEYKFLQSPPKRAFTPKLSALQIKWLNDRYDEGRNVAVIVGTPAGGIILSDRDWNGKIAPRAPASNDEVATWIQEQVA